MEVRIVKTEGIVGGKARIDGTRIRVIDIVEDYEILRNTIEEIAESYGITVVQVLEALKYYYENPEAIREEIKSEKRAFDKFKKEGNVLTIQHA